MLLENLFNFQDFLQFQEFLELEIPVELTLKTRENKYTDAVYLPKFSNKGNLKAHKITLFLGNHWDRRTITEVLAHELIHAWQQEQGIKEFHGPNFIMQAIAMKHAFNLPNIYIEELDDE